MLNFVLVYAAAFEDFLVIPPYMVWQLCPGCYTYAFGIASVHYIAKRHADTCSALPLRILQHLNIPSSHLRSYFGRRVLISAHVLVPVLHN